MENRHFCDPKDRCGSIKIHQSYFDRDEHGNFKRDENGKQILIKDDGWKIWCTEKGGWSDLITDNNQEITWGKDGNT